MCMLCNNDVIGFACIASNFAFRRRLKCVCLNRSCLAGNILSFQFTIYPLSYNVSFPTWMELAVSEFIYQVSELHKNFEENHYTRGKEYASRLFQVTDIHYK